MATNTTNYNLTKPEPTDFYDIGVTNENLDKIDTAIKSEADKISALTTTVNNKTQIATTAEAQAGTNNTKVMTPLRVKEVADTKVSKTGDTMTGDLKVKKGVPQLILETGNASTNHVIQLNANDTVNNGANFQIGGAQYLRVLGAQNVQFLGLDNVWTSFQDLKQGLVNGLSNIAAAVTSKGVTTASDANVSTIVTNINAIPSGKRVATGQSARVDDYFLINIPFTPASIQYRSSSAGGTIYDSGQYIKGGTLPGLSSDYSYFVNGTTGVQSAPRVVNNLNNNWLITHETIRNSGISSFSWIAYE